MAKTDLKWNSTDSKLPASVMCKVPTTAKMGMIINSMGDEMKAMVDHMLTQLPNVGAVCSFSP